MTVLIFTILSAVAAIGAIAARVLLALAVNADARSRNLKSATLFAILMFFFPLIVGIIYAAMRDNGEPNEKYCTSCHLKVDGAAKMCPNCNTMTLAPVPNPNAKELAKKGVTLCVIGIIVFAVSLGASTARTVYGVKMGLDFAQGIDEEKLQQWADKFADDAEDTTETDDAADTSDAEDSTDIDSVLGNLRFYDRNGKAYKDLTEVPYYDRDGKVYLYRKDKDLNQYFIEKDSKKKLEFKKCFVDSEGYFFYDEKGEITVTDLVTGVDKDGNQYTPASLAIWNEKGELMNMFN
jgi:hypothetical protein